MKQHKLFVIVIVILMLTQITALADPTISPTVGQTVSPTIEPTLSPTDEDTASIEPTLSPTPTATPEESDEPPLVLPEPQLLPSDSTEPELLKEGSYGDSVVLLQMRLRDLGYYNYKITNYFGALTQESVKAFQKENNLPVDGTVGSKTSDVLYNNTAIRKPVKPIIKPTTVPRAPKVAKGKMWDWFTKVNRLIPRGSKFYIIDVNTGTKMLMVRVGGSNHADVEPATKADTAKLKRVYGGGWDWSRRAVICYINGTWVAGSINGMPHGYETVGGNNMTGQVCIHFLNSKTHIHNMKDPEHQAMVRKAAGLR